MELEAAANPIDDGPVTLADPLQDTSSQAPTVGAEPEASIDDLTKEALGNPEATPEEEIEIEYDGDKRKLPPKWRDAFLRHQDYTKKTMELSEGRKSFEEQRQVFEQSRQMVAAEFQAHVRLDVLKHQITNLSLQSTDYWTDEDIAAGRQSLAALQAEYNTLNQTLSNHHQQKAMAERADSERRRQAALSEVAAKVPNFTDQRRTELEKLAVEVGAPPEEVAGLSDPWAYELLHFADIGKKFIERQRKAASMRTAQAGTPATMLGSASGGSKAPEEMSMAEYAAWRNAGNG